MNEHIFEDAEELVKSFERAFGKEDACFDYRKDIEDLKRQMWVLREALYRMRSRIEQNNIP